MIASIIEEWLGIIELIDYWQTSRHVPPLVVRVDVPDAALGEDLVLVDGDEGA